MGIISEAIDQWINNLPLDELETKLLANGVTVGVDGVGITTTSMVSLDEHPEPSSPEAV